MILPDVNVLVFAYRRESAAHDLYRAWLGRLLTGGEEIALVESVLVAFVRIVTNPRTVPDPAPTPSALQFVDALRNAPRARWLPSTAAAWELLREICRRDRQVRANLVPDAWLASLARAHGCRLATADRGFARFEGLDWFDPAA